MDTVTLLMSICFIGIGSLCWWNFCFSVSKSPNFILFSFFYTSCLKTLGVSYFAMFSFLLVFIVVFSDVFIVDGICLVSSLLVLLPGVLLIWESLLYSQAFFTLNSFPLLSRLPLKVKFLPTEIWNTDPVHLFVWITQCSATI